MFIDAAIDENTLVRNNCDKDFNNHYIANISSITLNTQAVNDNHVITKSYVDHFPQEIERTGRDLGIDFYNESNDLVKINQDKNFNKNKVTN